MGTSRPQVYPRYSDNRVREALRDTRIVVISGPRQSGKTTLARRFARRRRTYLSLDNQATLAAARSDPVAFIRELDRAVIDEVQRAPGLLPAIKQSVDRDPRPGRFLLTSAANPIGAVSDFLSGRGEVIPLYPLGRGERRSRMPTFIPKVFRGLIPHAAESLSGDKLLQVVAAGGYPDAIKRRNERRRSDWHRHYVKTITERDVPEIAHLGAPGQIPRLLELAARSAGRLTNLSELGRALTLDHKTIAHYLNVLEQIYLLQQVPPWSREGLYRLVKTPKLHFVDSGLLASLRRCSVGRLRADRRLWGTLLQSFVFSELLKAIAWADQPVSISHYRDKDQVEVDFVLEDTTGHLVGIAIKAAASVKRRDFAGLERLAAAAGTAFVQGILLHDGDQTSAFGERLRAVPLPALWA